MFHTGCFLSIVRAVESGAMSYTQIGALSFDDIRRNVEVQHSHAMVQASGNEFLRWAGPKLYDNKLRNI